MVNVIVGRKRDIRISANATGGIIDTTVPVTIKNTPTLGNIGSAQRLDRLQDVSATNEITGAVPVYDSSLDKYIVKKVDLGSDVVGDLDGGNF
jgi:hypothetical protein